MGNSRLVLKLVHAVKDLIFPVQRRLLPGARWANILLRVLHVIGAGGLVGSNLFSVSQIHWMPYLYLTLISGVVMLLLEVSSSAIYVLQLSGVAVVVKIVLFSIIPWFPDFKLGILLLMLVLSVVFSHAPSSVRHYSIWHGRVIEDYCKKQTD
jgi:hypothetical protein